MRFSFAADTKETMGRSNKATGVKARSQISLLVCLAVLPQVPAQGKSPKDTPVTPPIQFVTEFARELVAIEEVRARGAADLNATKDTNGKLASAIHFSTLMQLELRSQIGMLTGMRLTGQFADLIPDLIGLYQQKIDLHQQMIDVVTEILSGPKSGVDYGKIAAQIPKIRAKLEYVDHTIFANVTPLACMTLLDMRVDSRNHVSHLVITKAEKDELVGKLVSGFGKAFDQDKKNFTVSAGLVMKGFLQDHVASDSPWE